MYSARGDLCSILVKYFPFAKFHLFFVMPIRHKFRFFAVKFWELFYRNDSLFKRKPIKVEIEAGRLSITPIRDLHSCVVLCAKEAPYGASFYF